MHEDDVKHALLQQIIEGSSRPLDGGSKAAMDALIEKYRTAPGFGVCGRCGGTCESRSALSREGRGNVCSFCGILEALGVAPPSARPRRLPR